MMGVKRFNFIYLVLIWMIVTEDLTIDDKEKSWLCDVTRLYIQIKNSSDNEVVGLSL